MVAACKSLLTVLKGEGAFSSEVTMSSSPWTVTYTPQHYSESLLRAVRSSLSGSAVPFQYADWLSHVSPTVGYLSAPHGYSGTEKSIKVFLCKQAPQCLLRHLLDLKCPGEGNEETQTVCLKKITAQIKTCSKCPQAPLWLYPLGF